MIVRVRHHIRRMPSGYTSVRQHQRNLDSLNIQQGKKIMLTTIESDQQYYKKLVFWKSVFEAKKARGVYSRELALRGLKNNFVPELIIAYNKRHKERVSEETKNWVARASLEMIEGMSDG